MKYKIGDVITCKSIRVIVQIIDIDNDKYVYKFISHYNTDSINKVWACNSRSVELIVRIASNEEKLELL